MSAFLTSKAADNAFDHAHTRLKLRSDREKKKINAYTREDVNHELAVMLQEQLDEMFQLSSGPKYQSVSDRTEKWTVIDWGSEAHIMGGYRC